MKITVGQRKGIEITTILQYILLYVMLISHGAKIYAQNSEMIRYGIIIMSVCYIVYHKSLVNNTYVSHAIILMSLMAALVIIHNEVYFVSVGLRVIEHFLILFIAYDICRDRFFERFIKLTVFFAIVSLFFYSIQLLDPSILVKIFRPVEGWGNGQNWGSEFYGVLLYTYRGTLSNYRNNGIFTEPGLYQMILNAAIMILLFFPQLSNLSSKQIRRAIIVLFITVLSTGSTTGYISLFILMIGYLLKKSNGEDEHKNRRYVIWVLVALSGVVIVDYYTRNENSLLYSFVFSKFEDMGMREDASGNGRLMVLQICSELLRTSGIGLLTGVGYGNVTFALNSASGVTGGAFIVSYIAAVGLPIAIFTVYPYLFRVFRHQQFWIECIICLMLYINTSIAQSREAYPTLLLLPYAIFEYNVLIQNIEAQ